ncbi:hypothetical protein HDZ31DRAFT_74880 [Schizophyllum fasciatum]
MPPTGGTSNAPSATSAGGQSHPQVPPGQSDGYKEYTETPSHGTRPTRPTELLRSRLKNLIGLAICLVTNKMTAPWEVHAMHIMCRSLDEFDPVAYKCFVENVGEVRKGKRRVNLDHIGNVEFGQSWQELQAGTFILSDEYRMLRFPFQMYPTEDGPHEYIVYGFPNEHQHVFGRYSNTPRTYAHSLGANNYHDDDGDAGNATDTLVPEGAGSAVNGASCNAAEPTRPAPKEVFAAYKREQFAKVEKRDLVIGDQGFIVISHLNPIFVIFDYTAKMRYRISHMRDAQIPAEDLEFFHEEIWPVVRHWFEPEEAEAASDGVVTRSQTRAKNEKAQTEPVDTGSPVTPEPAADDEQSEVGDASEQSSNSMPTGTHDVTTGNASSAATHSVIGPHRSALKKPDAATSDVRRSLRFADVNNDRSSDAAGTAVSDFQHADSMSERTTAPVSDPPFVAPAIDTPATHAPDSQVTTLAQPMPDAQAQPRRTTRPNAGRRLPLAPPAQGSARTASKRSGKAKATITVAHDTSTKHAAPPAPSASNQGSRELRSRTKATGDKRSREDIPSDNDNADMPESEDVPLAKKARIRKGKMRTNGQSQAGPSRSQG